LLSEDSRHPDYQRWYNKLKEEVKRYYEPRPESGMFTLHGSSHCANVEKMIKVIVSKAGIDLSGTERFLLSCAAWTHDLGMNEEISRDYFAGVKGEGEGISPEKRRSEHHNASCWYLQEKYQRLFEEHTTDSDQTTAILRAISTIIQYHRKGEDITRCNDLLSIKGEIVRIKLLAAIFRLADTLHKDSTRFDPYEYAVLNMVSFGRESRLHWLKSFVVSNIHLNESEQVITVQLDLPDYTQFIEWQNETNLSARDKMARVWEDGARNLKHIVSSDIEEDLVVVNSIFSRYRMPTYVTVDVRVSQVRGFTKERYHEIRGILSDLDIVFSPNTSKVIRRTLDSMKSLCSSSADDNTFASQLQQFLKYLNEIHKNRPCHVGLRKIIDLLGLLPDGDNGDTVRRKITAVVNGIEEFRVEAVDKILERANEIVAKGITDIFLIGFSETITRLLEKIAQTQPERKHKMSIYVLECATKRRLSHSNLIEYNDGIHYATEIGKLDFYHISIIPDLGFATQLQSQRQEREDRALRKTHLVLFGANGIDEDTGDCGHTSGYLSVAIVAKEFEIPVKVLADSFKFGHVDWHSGERRKSEWLTTQRKYVEQLESVHVDRINLREDKFPARLVEQIFTEDHTLMFESGSTCFKRQLQDIKKCSKDFFERLKREV